jgi:hypothetical protein
MILGVVVAIGGLKGMNKPYACFVSPVSRMIHGAHYSFDSFGYSDGSDVYVWKGERGLRTGSCLREPVARRGYDDVVRCKRPTQ